MTAPNHIAGGIVITGIAGSFMGVNILSSPWYIAVAAVASILPDIDHTKSIIGKMVYPIARYINRRWGHRTITHSAIFWIFACLVFNALFQDRELGIIFAVSYGTHLLLDMVTIQGIPLLYPFKRNPFVLPGEKNYRFKTGNLRDETKVFCFLILSGIWMQPLMATGFWTQYNRFFGTPIHLVSEYHKTPNLLKVDYEIKEGTEISKGWGYCIEVSENKVILLDSIEEIVVLDASKHFIKSVIPTHTNRKLKFEKVNFVSISSDSLNQLLGNEMIKEIEVIANNEFKLNGNHEKKLKVNYPGQLIFESIGIDVKKERFVYQVSPRLKTLEKKIQLLESKQRLDEGRFNRETAKFEKLSLDVTKEKDLFKRDELLKEIASLKNIKDPIDNSSRIIELTSEIKEIREEDILKNQLRKNELDTKFLESIPEQTRFTGFAELVKIS